ncbi:MAG: tRNA dihydrouridine synthase DusB [Planctomyces sp.]|nr:tRNA dihydrouridine synthase DusB [Planctomyces sp.]
MNAEAQSPRVAPRPLCYGALELPSRYLLSPLAGYTNLPFRRVVRELGGLGLATTDLVSARGLLEGSAKSLQLIESCPEDRPFAVQLFGSEPETLCDAAQLLVERGVDSIDINMGCPVRRITAGGAGSAMLCQTDATLRLVRTVVERTPVPVTVKMRLGWDDSQITAPEFAREFAQLGVAAIAVHGRTREQGFSGAVNRDGIRRVVEAAPSIPVIGNGDIRTVEDAETMFRETGCAGISIGRGALANPWIFRQLVERETSGRCSPPGNFEERLALLRRQFGFLSDQIGERRAVSMFRKMGHWYLKAMRVRASLRNQFQIAQNRGELEQALAEIAAAGPSTGNRTGLLPEMHVAVPSGPVDRW